MLKQPLSLQAKFYLLVGAGVVVFLALVGLGTWLSYPAQTGPAEQPEHAQKNAEHPNGIPPNVIGTVIVTAPRETPSTDTERNESAQKSEQESFGFWGAKVTDLALVFFTYCLVVVGWVTMRSNESILQEIERARLFGGANINHTRNENGRLVIGVGIGNHGRTTAIMKERGYKFFAEEPSGPVSYEGGDIRHVDSAVAPETDGATPILDAESPLAYVGVHFLAGYVRYFDVFGTEHVTRYCQKITLEVGPPDQTGHGRVKITCFTAGAEPWHSDT